MAFLPTQSSEASYIIVEAANGREALDVIENQSVDIVLLDLVMPVMDSFEFLSIVKKNEKYIVDIIELKFENL